MDLAFGDRAVLDAARHDEDLTGTQIDVAVAELDGESPSMTTNSSSVSAWVLRWTAKSTRTLAETLTAQGHPVSDQTVAGLLRAAGCSLQANSKTREGRQHEDRDAQFPHIRDTSRRFLRTGDPVVRFRFHPGPRPGRRRRERRAPATNSLPGWHHHRVDGILIGRDAVVDRALPVLRAFGEMLLEGPAGIGKTAVLQGLIRRARGDGLLVLSCAPAESESALPLAALADVLGPLREHVTRLPPPQRDAVGAALVLCAGTGAVDERALAAATLTLLACAVAGSPAGVLVAIDDAPWLDPPSERALRFALRRRPDRVAVLVSRRSTEDTDGAAPLGLDEAGGAARVALPPLGPGALYHVLSGQFGASLSRPLVSRIARESAGNPLLAIELTRAVLRLPERPGPGEDLPVPRSMQELVAAILRSLPAPARTAVELAALLSAPDLAGLSAAGVTLDALDAAEAAGLVGVGADGRVGFTHPVHAAAVRAGVPRGRRGRLHARLAAVATDPDERARQLLHSALTRDDAAADALAAAGERARRRGAPDLAAAFYDRAAELSPGPASHGHRLAAVACRYEAGDYAGAAQAADVLAADASGDRLAEALLIRSAVAFSADDDALAVVAAQRALAAATPAGRLAGRIHAHLAVFTDAAATARAHAEAASRLLTESEDAGGPGSVLARDDRSLLASALMLLFLNEVRAGGVPRADVLDRAIALEAGRPASLSSTVPAIWWKSIDEHDRARDRLSWLLGLAQADGDEPWQHEILAHLAETELLAGRFSAAAARVAQTRELGEQLGSGLLSETWLAGMVDAHTGAADAAAAAAADGLREAEASGVPWVRRINLQLAAFSALVAGRSAESAARYAELAADIDASGLAEPLSTRFEGDWAEACVDSGDLATAAAALHRLRARHERLPRPWTALALARAEVLLAAACGAETAESVDRMVAECAGPAGSSVPFERARCLLVGGLAHRRARRRAAARELLLLAAVEFAALGAEGFAERARGEAARTGARRADADLLTSTERRVAELAAAGRTNRAVADVLFVSPKTVEANLARVYRKLGISTRAELGAAMAERSAQS